MKQYIKILKYAQNVQIIRLNIGKDISPIPSPIFIGGVKKQILSNFTILVALISKHRNRPKI